MKSLHPYDVKMMLISDPTCYIRFPSTSHFSISLRISPNIPQSLISTWRLSVRPRVPAAWLPSPALTPVHPKSHGCTEYPHSEDTICLFITKVIIELTRSYYGQRMNSFRCRIKVLLYDYSAQMGKSGWNLFWEQVWAHEMLLALRPLICYCTPETTLTMVIIITIILLLLLYMVATYNTIHIFIYILFIYVHIQI